MSYLWKSRTSGIRRGQEFLVLLPTAMILGLLAVRAAPGVAIDVLTFAAVLVLAFRSRLWATTLATAGLFAVGAYGIKWALTWHGTSGRWPTRREASATC